MESKYFLDGESIIAQLKLHGAVVTLTNYRIRHEFKSMGGTHIVSIMLDKICSIEFHNERAPILLFMGGVIAMLGLMPALISQREGGIILGILIILIGALIFLFYFAFQKHEVVIAPCGGRKITIETKGMKRKNILEFINQIEQAKKNLLAKVNES